MTLSKSMMMTFAAAVVALLVVQAPATAVTAMRVNVPFDFVANGKVHGAGTYMIRNDRIQGLLEFVGNDGNGFAVLTTLTGARNDSTLPSLEFRKSATGNVLATVYMPGYENGFQLPGAGKLTGESYRLAVQR